MSYIIKFLHFQVITPNKIGIPKKVGIKCLFIQLPHCNCPHAEGTKIVCKHRVALYFAIFPEKAKQFMEEIDEYNRKVDKYKQELEIKVKKYIKSMSKKELEEALLECLYQVDWLFDNFIRDKVGY